MSSSWWTLIRSRLPDPVGGFILSRSERCTRKLALLRLCSVKLQDFGCVQMTENAL